MLKMSARVAALFVAGLISLACSSSGLKDRGSSAGAGSVANGGQAGSGAVGGAGGTVGAGGSVLGGAGGIAGTGGSGATACFSLFHACANSADCCAPNRCLNITGTLACQQEGPSVGGSMATGGNGGIAGAGGASSSGSGGFCYDSSGAIATAARVCTLASDCKQVTKPGCCGNSQVGLATSSSCTFPAPPCTPTLCIGPVYQQADDGKTTAQGGTVGLKCVSGQCMTFVMASGIDAGADVNGGATSSGGAAGSGGTQAGGGVTGTGGSTSASDGSVSTTDLDTCASDADCTSCNWGKAPTDSSQCTGTYCCGGPISSKKRCEASQAAWALYCPNQLPKPIVCQCEDLRCTGEFIGCVGGRCGLWCPPAVDAAGRDGPVY